jgi:hypothetical protein
MKCVCLYIKRAVCLWFGVNGCKGECASSVRVGKKDSDVINYSGAQQEAASGILKLKSLMTANSTPQTTWRGGVEIIYERLLRESKSNLASRACWH